ncbi:MAG: MoaD/ThiS family protein [Chloroflexota bacterium]
MSEIIVSVRLYGELSCYGKRLAHNGVYSTVNVNLPEGSLLKDLIEYLLMCTNERGFTFINEELSAMPNVQPDLDQALKDGDRVIFFPLQSTTLMQFHFGKMTDALNKEMQIREDRSLLQAQQQK